MRDAADPMVVGITGGRVSGAFEDGVHVFRGLPYAAPLKGANRWRPPQPVEAWDGVREATRFGPACPQQTLSGGAASLLRWKTSSRLFLDTIGELGAPQGEDSLVLNVWTPSVDPAARLPVLVFIHG